MTPPRQPSRRKPRKPPRQEPRQPPNQPLRPARRSGPDLLVPAYFHPAVADEQWERLADPGQPLRLVVINVNSGPGEVVDPSYLPVVAALHTAGVRLAGYVDSDYGRRPLADVAAEVRAYLRRYQVSGLFLDQVSAGFDDLDLYAQYVVTARSAGASFVVLNPGTHPHPGYVDLANITVTFEGTWADYQQLTVPDWAYRKPARRLAHLVHSMPADAFDATLALASRRNVGTVFLTDGRGANPWDHYPAALTAAMAPLAAAVPAP
jgi:hypothetical protein